MLVKWCSNQIFWLERFSTTMSHKTLLLFLFILFIKHFRKKKFPFLGGGGAGRRGGRGR